MSQQIQQTRSNIPVSYRTVIKFEAYCVTHMGDCLCERDGTPKIFTDRVEAHNMAVGAYGKVVKASISVELHR